MKRLQGRVVSVSAGGADDLSKQEQESIEVNLSGIVGDHHAGASREAYDGEREPEGTVLRNDRQWSAVSREELTVISGQLDLLQPIAAATVGANLCFEGIEDLSLLPRGTRFKFPSGAALTVEEYNPPCIDMGAQIAAKHTRRDGQALKPRDWLRPASGRRGLVGVVDVAGVIRAGDAVTVELFETPRIPRFDD